MGEIVGAEVEDKYKKLADSPYLIDQTEQKVIVARMFYKKQNDAKRI